MRMAVLNSGQAATVPATTDWLSLSKTVVIEAAFLLSTVDLLFFNGGVGATQLAFATGATLGVLRIGDVVANVFNVKSIANSPTAQQAGIVPQPSGTPLITTPSGGTTNGSKS